MPTALAPRTSADGAAGKSQRNAAWFSVALQKLMLETFAGKTVKQGVGESRQCTGLENRPPSLCSLPKAWRARRTRATSTGITQVALHQAVFVQYDGAVYLVDTPQLEKQGSWKARIQHNPAFLMRCS